MAELISQFTTACSNVEPEPDDVANAAAAYRKVRECLEQDELTAFGIDTILIGSYAREVSIRRVKDVDVFSKLPDVEVHLTSSDLLDLLESALEQYGDRLDRQDRSICIDFPDYGLTVDAVPAPRPGTTGRSPTARRTGRDRSPTRRGWRPRAPR